MSGSTTIGVRSEGVPEFSFSLGSIDDESLAKILCGLLWARKQISTPALAELMLVLVRDLDRRFRGAGVVGGTASYYSLPLRLESLSDLDLVKLIGAIVGLESSVVPPGSSPERDLINGLLEFFRLEMFRRQPQLRRLKLYTDSREWFSHALQYWRK